MNVSLSNTPWLPRFEPRDDIGVRLFCFPHAGSGASMYHPWTRAHAPGLQVLPVQYPGREERFEEPPRSDLPALVDELADVLEPLVAEPFALFGHSMGTLYAFELARRLRSKHRVSPVHLFVSAFPAPQIRNERDLLHELPDDQLLAGLRDRYGEVAGQLLNNSDLVQALMPVIRADVTLVETYTYTEEPPLECSITAIGGRDDKAVSMADLSAWRQQTSGQYGVRLLPGGHFYLENSYDAVMQVIEHRLREFLRS